MGTIIDGPAPHLYQTQSSLEDRVRARPWFGMGTAFAISISSYLSSIFLGAVDGALSEDGGNPLLPYGGAAILPMIVNGLVGFDDLRAALTSGLETPSVTETLKFCPGSSLGSAGISASGPLASYWIARGASYLTLRLVR